MSARSVGAGTVAAVALAATLAAVTLASPASAATDLATGRPVSADSVETGHGAALANDGNAGTRWCAADAQTGHWWQVDLGSSVQVTSTNVQWEFARNYRFRLTVSADGTTWTTALDQTSTTSTSQSRTDTVTATARYVRLTITGLAAGSWASIASFSVFGTPAPTSAAPFKGVANSACADLPRLTVSWWYNWWISPNGCTVPGFVPMISGKDKHGAGDVAWARDQAVNAGYKTILGFNEPNKADQANMSVATAVALWPTVTANAAIRVGSPVASTDGQAWFTDFMNQVAAKKLRVDFIALHWYGWNAGSCDANAAQLESYLRWAESFPGNRPIWITEMGCMNQSNPNMATVTAFYTAALAVFARHPRVERYAWYPWNTNNELVGSSGALTSLGSAVARAPAFR